MSALVLGVNVEFLFGPSLNSTVSLSAVSVTIVFVDAEIVELVVELAVEVLEVFVTGVVAEVGSEVVVVVVDVVSKVVVELAVVVLAVPGKMVTVGSGVEAVGEILEIGFVTASGDTRVTSLS